MGLPSWPSTQEITSGQGGSGMMRWCSDGGRDRAAGVFSTAPVSPPWAPRSQPPSRFRDDMPEFYRQQPTWELEALRRALPASVQYRNEVRGHRALGGRPAMTRLAEQHRMAVPWVLDTREEYARYPMM